MTLVIHFPSEKSILPNFSMLRGVAILDCESHSQAGSTSLMWSSKSNHSSNSSIITQKMMTNDVDEDAVKAMMMLVLMVIAWSH